jgi:hypothetical protein
MSAQAESSTSAVPSGQTRAESASVYVHGALSGIVGAATVALWFFYLDFSRHRMLFTPTVLGTVLFGGGKGPTTPEAVQPSVSMTALFTLVHGAVFIVMGIAAARWLDALEHRPNVFLSIVLMFVVLGLGFLAFAMSFAALPLDVLSWADILFGNVLAAVAMVVYLWRRRPHPE